MVVSSRVNNAGLGCARASNNTWKTQGSYLKLGSWYGMQNWILIYLKYAIPLNEKEILHRRWSKVNMTRQGHQGSIRCGCIGPTAFTILMWSGTYLEIILQLCRQDGIVPYGYPFNI